MITICMTYFRSLQLANLAAALESVRRQDLSRVAEVLVLDNNTEDKAVRIESLVSWFNLPVPTTTLYRKHGDPLKTHSWSTNEVVRDARTPWVLFTRADYVLHEDLVKRFADVVAMHDPDWNGFVTSDGRHLHVDVAECEQSEWKVNGASALRGVRGSDFNYTLIDAGVWMARKAAFDAVGGLEEGLTAWGHAQTHFQWKLHKAGVDMVRIPEVLFYHPQHAGERDIAQAHAQIEQLGVSVGDMWARHDGPKPYGGAR